MKTYMRDPDNEANYDAMELRLDADAKIHENLCFEFLAGVDIENDFLQLTSKSSIDY